MKWLKAEFGVADNNLTIAEKSLHEELKAVEDYTERAAATNDSKLKEIFEHAIKEEREHSELFQKWIDAR